ncbi:MAG: isochorismate synthase [Actinomycetota bacterium]|jgi:menaquinone-specific isochorismate synthase|nr:isochorismate synthase [Actinomycetota bacterium]
MRTPSLASPSVHTVEVGDPQDLLAHLAADHPVAWVRDGQGLVGWGQLARVDLGTGPRRFARAQAVLADLAARVAVNDEVGLPGCGLVAFASFTFDERSRGSVLVVPRVVLGRRQGRAWLTTVGDRATPPGLTLHALPGPRRVRYASGGADEVRWVEAVDEAVREIKDGQLDKVVLARDVRVWSEEPLDTRVLARRLAERFSSCFTFVCDGLVGATPELLLRLRAGRVESIVLAGSAPRGADAGADQRLGQALLASGKDRQEHELAVASVRDVLARLCDQLTVDQTPRLLRLANVQHLASTAHGTLTDDGRVLDVVAALHPTAAVCGTPRAAALQRVRALEGMDRGRYSGPVGWFDADGDGEWGVALRCAEVEGSRARLFAGAGIVDGSLPEAELEETRLKLRAMQSALDGH